MIDCYIRDVRECLKHRYYFAALSLALTLPDICGMVEWPDKSVTERYIGWADKYLAPRMSRDDSQTPYLSGEVIYNLRNTFLHQGAPTVNGQKVKEPRNQLDEFRLILGDGDIHSVSFTLSRRDADVRMLIVNVRYLCSAICDVTDAYWQSRKGQFDFGYQALTEEELMGAKNPLRNCSEEVVNGPAISADPPIKVPAPPRKKSVPSAQGTLSASKKNAEPWISEHKLRCYFGQHFKEQRFKTRKEEFLQAVLTANTKVELNNHLTRLFKGPDVKLIHERLKPLTNKLPGQ